MYNNSDFSFPSLYFSLLSSSSIIPQIHSHLIFPQKRAGLPGTSIKYAQDTIRPDTDLHIKAGQGNTVGGKGSQKKTEVSETPLLLLSGVLPKHPDSNYNIHAEDLAQTRADSTNAASTSVSLYEPC